MGREWLHWVAGGRPSTRRRRLTAENEETSSPGCMCAVFQLFDLQHHPFSYQPDSEATTSKGVVAPRNSSELEETASMKVASSMPLAMKDEEISNFPVGINQIKTRVASKSRTEDNLSSDCSPGTAKTPNLVARLMGLDLLPECNNSPSLSSSNSKTHNKSNVINQKKDTRITQKRSKNFFSDDDIAIGARSSSAQISDFEYSRLSLQINKENNAEFAISAKMRDRSAKFRQDENTSPARNFAKQIADQVKEKISRKVGLVDITNTNYREHDEKIFRRDQDLVIYHPTKKNNRNVLPKIKPLDTKKKIITSSGTKSPRNSTSSCDGNYDQSKGVIKDGKKARGGNGNNSSGMSKFQLAPQTCDYSARNKKSEAFVHRVAKGKTNHLTDKKKTRKLASLMSSEILNISGPTLLPVKKDPSPPATKLPQKQSQVSDALSSKRNTQLSCKSSRPYKHLSLQSAEISTVLPVPDRTKGCATTTSAAAAPEYKDYVQKILKCAGINDEHTPLTLAKWHTASHPLDPSILYYLELFSGGGPAGGILSRRCNRKLIFQLVDELLAEILKPYLDFKQCTDFNIPVGIDQFSVRDELCKKIGDFPAADCRVLEDIDSLIERDLCNLRQNWFFEDEKESLVCEIEGEIMERLVRETVAAAVRIRK